MRLLLDTHVFLWLATEPTKIPADMLSILSDPHIQLLLSLEKLQIVSADGLLDQYNISRRW
jgi:PIN domain nuclease of toxin-antitoxin system